MARTKGTLNAKSRRALPSSSFVLAGRRYPIHDRAHGANALARARQSKSSSTYSQVRAAVCRRYPSLPACKRTTARKGTKSRR